GRQPHLELPLAVHEGHQEGRVPRPDQEDEGQAREGRRVTTTPPCREPEANAGRRARRPALLFCTVTGGPARSVRVEATRTRLLGASVDTLTPDGCWTQGARARPVAPRARACGGRGASAAGR